MLFSIIIPVFNERKYIRKCIDLILPQKCCDYEIILVDDGSTDGTSDICDDYAQEYERVRVIHKPNGGLVSARNAGIKVANGEYILYVDGDDRVSPEWLKTIYTCITSAPQKPDLVVFGSSSQQADHLGIHHINCKEGYYDRQRLEKEIFPRVISDPELYIEDAVFLPAPWNKAYKKELLEAHYCRDEQICLGEDTAFAFECVLCANSMVVTKDILYFYNKMNTASMTSKYDPDCIRKRLRLFQYVEERLGDTDPVIMRQLDDFYASRIICDLVNICLYNDDMRYAANHLRKELRSTQILKYVHVSNIPIRAKIIIIMLKMGFCRTISLLLRRFYT
ncbi:MAG: glycosyltransferase [Lachnospiraceae bacterium]|nr:glycosyltransferase [Lachnospiraceae bacterium]